MQVSEVILYNHEGQTRHLEFRLGELNVITGIADSGKTAVLEIIHYCLGDNDDVRISRSMITRVVAWFAVRVRIGELDIFIARPSPDHPDFANNAVALDVGDRPIPPLDDLEPTTTLDGLNSYLGRVLQIEENVSVLPEPSRPELEARFRHSLFYCFQRQYEIATPEQLFHRQGQPFIKTTIQDTLPYFIGAAPPDHVERQRELRRLRHELRAAHSHLESLQQTHVQALKRALTLLSQAREVGLADEQSDPEDTAQAASVLRAAMDSRAGLPELSAAAGRELRRIEDRRVELADELRGVRDEIDLVRTLNTEDVGFESALAEHTARLTSIEILPNEGHVCPLCERPTDGVTPGADEVRELLVATSKRLELAQREAPRLQAVLANLEEQYVVLQRKLTETQSALQALQTQREEVERFRGSVNTQSYVRGRIAQYLEAVEEADDTHLAAAQLQVALLEQQVSSAEEILGPQALRDRVDAILGAVGQDMQHWAARLKLSHSDSPVEIHPTKLTVVARTPHGPIYLHEMGGGSNWVGYHLVSHLALHKHFANERRPVPRFLFLDQMSQAFYPPESPANKPDMWPHLEDDDRQRVRGMFLLIRDVVAQLDGKVQVIATDHARLQEEWFLDAIRYDWHDGERLVPASWIPDEYLQVEE